MLQIRAALFYYKLGQTLLQIGAAITNWEQNLFQISAGITNHGSYYKFGHNTCRYLRFPVCVSMYVHVISCHIVASV